MILNTLQWVTALAVIAISSRCVLAALQDLTHYKLLRGLGWIILTIFTNRVTLHFSWMQTEGQQKLTLLYTGLLIATIIYAISIALTDLLHKITTQHKRQRHPRKKRKPTNKHAATTRHISNKRKPATPTRTTKTSQPRKTITTKT